MMTMKSPLLALALVSAGCSVNVDTGLGGTVTAGWTSLHPYTTLPTSSMTQTNVDWSSNAVAFRGQNGLRVKYDCPAGGTLGSPWGTDIYTDDSSVCSAAVHYGRIGPVAGGSVVIEIRPGLSSYSASLRNGVQNQDYPAWTGSFVVL